MKAPETIFRTSSNELVPETDPKAAFLVCRKGSDVPPDVEKRYGLKQRWAGIPAKEEKPAAPRTNRAISGDSLKKRDA